MKLTSVWRGGGEGDKSLKGKRGLSICTRRSEGQLARGNCVMETPKEDSNANKIIEGMNRKASPCPNIDPPQSRCANVEEVNLLI
jgi:hypothetical protein